MTEASLNVLIHTKKKNPPQVVTHCRGLQASSCRSDRIPFKNQQSRAIRHRTASADKMDSWSVWWVRSRSCWVIKRRADVVVVLPRREAFLRLDSDAPAVSQYARLFLPSCSSAGLTPITSSSSVCVWEKEKVQINGPDYNLVPVIVKF